MPMTSQRATPSPTNLDRLRTACLELKGYLGGAKQALEEEIRTYPTPIPRCDAQFNYLYEQRSRLCQILDRVSAALDHGNSSDEFAEAIAAFTASPYFGESVEEQNLRERLRAEL
ncbi:MAG: hypothetical protein ABWY12_15485 [Burkholderiales bacterium]